MGGLKMVTPEEGEWFQSFPGKNWRSVCPFQ
jgi:hypothetical protein